MSRQSIHRFYAENPPRSASSPSAAFAPLPETLRDGANAAALREIYTLARKQAEEQVARQREVRRDVSRFN
jgi:hypothetical protein